MSGALAGLSLSILLASLGTSGANVALPTLAKAFGASFHAVQWVVLSYLLAVTTTTVAVGRLGDLYGRRGSLHVGIALFTVASFACGLAPSLPVLIAARAVQGLGAAVMTSLSLASVGDIVPRARLGRSMGLLGTMSALGTALGPSLGGILLGFSGWRALFLVNVPLGLTAVWLVHRSPSEERTNAQGDRSFDLAGVALLGSRARVPILPPSLLQDRNLGVNLLSNGLVACVMMGTLIVGPFYLTRALGLAPAAMGLVMAVGPVLTALAGVPAGRLVDHRGTFNATLVGLASMVVGSVLLAALSGRFGVAGYVGPIVLLTSGYALFQAANNTAVMADTAAGARGVVSGALSLSRNLGLITGASLMGAVFAHAANGTDAASMPPSAAAQGMRVTFLVGAALVATAIAVTTVRRAGRLGVPATYASGPEGHQVEG